MAETLTMVEIERRFSGEWVLLQDPVLSDDLEMISGTLVFHSRNRATVYGRLAELGAGDCAVQDIGAVPDDVLYAL